MGGGTRTEITHIEREPLRPSARNQLSEDEYPAYLYPRNEYPPEINLFYARMNILLPFIREMNILLQKSIFGEDEYPACFYPRNEYPPCFYSRNEYPPSFYPRNEYPPPEINFWRGWISSFLLSEKWISSSMNILQKSIYFMRGWISSFLLSEKWIYPRNKYPPSFYLPSIYFIRGWKIRIEIRKIYFIRGWISSFNLFYSRMKNPPCF